MEKEYEINLKSIEDAKELVGVTTQYDFDIDLSYQRNVVDAKSILGVISLGCSHILKLTCQEHSPELEQNLQRFVVE